MIRANRDKTSNIANLKMCLFMLNTIYYLAIYFKVKQ